MAALNLDIEELSNQPFLIQLDSCTRRRIDIIVEVCIILLRNVDNLLYRINDSHRLRTLGRVSVRYLEVLYSYAHTMTIYP
jgi:hypothetical protein